MSPHKVKNPLEVAGDRLVSKFGILTKNMRFTDSTPVEEDVLKTRAHLLECEEFEVLGYLNDPVGQVTLLVTSKDSSAVAIWDEVNHGQLGILTVSAKTLADLTQVFITAGACTPATLKPHRHDEEF